MERNRIYTTFHVEQHKSKQDCWLIIDGRVLNMTKFLEEHPGGEEALLEFAGKDASKAFLDVGHSQAANDLFPRFQVGCLQSYHNVKDTNDHFPEAKEMEAFVIEDDLALENSRVVHFLGPLFVALLYFGYLYLTGAVKLVSK